VCTGGTIVSTVHDGTARIDEGLVDALAQEVGGERDRFVEVEVHRPFLLHSEDVQPGHWLALAALIAEISAEVDGIVVLHGTDTAAYTAAALHYLLAGVPKPVVVTGAMIPAGLAGSDAVANVRAAVAAALSTLPPGAYLAFCNSQGDGVVYAGTRVRKSNRVGPFESVGRLPVGVVVEDELVPLAPILPTSVRATGRLVGPVLDDRVMVIDCHPGQRLPAAARAAADAGMRGIVFTLYHSGTASTEGEWSAVAAVQTAREAGLVTVGVARGSGSRPPIAYPSSSALVGSGLVLVDGLPVEAAVPKLMWALAQCDSRDSAAELVRLPVRTDCD
jgi:L-asparaginase